MLHEIAEAARHDLMLCSFALDEAAALRRKDLFDLRRTLAAPVMRWKLSRARKHRIAAKRRIDSLHTALHDRASLGVHNADLWSAITRAVDALALSRWLNAKQLAPEDLAPARTTVQLLLTELVELIGLLHELAWPDEMPERQLVTDP
ncbi:MAG TPA: hypothetical protein VIV40_07035 [Kofleriaceae bacterium]